MLVSGLRFILAEAVWRTESAESRGVMVSGHHSVRTFVLPSRAFPAPRDKKNFPEGAIYPFRKDHLPSFDDLDDLGVQFSH